MKKVSKKTLALIDQLVLEKYPTARKIDSKHLRDREFDGFYPIAHYVILEQEGADEFGFDGESEEYEIVAVSFSMHAESKRIFFWEMNNYGEPDASYGESNGELVDGELIIEFAREHELC
jgi:hypothetical protein